MKVASFILCFAACFAIVARSAEKAEETKVASAAFAELKKLAGDWVQADKDGKPTGQVVWTIRVVSNGSAIQETIFPGNPKEMITMYHMDGPELVLTHHCALG